MLKGRSAEESAVLEAQKAGSRKSWPRAVIVISRGRLGGAGGKPARSSCASTARRGAARGAPGPGGLPPYGGARGSGSI